jgi:hypothetical protein
MDVYERERSEDLARHTKEREEDRKAFAELLAEVKGIRDDQRTAALSWAHGCTTENCTMPAKVAALELLVAQGKTSWKTLSAAAGVAGAVVLFIQWVSEHVLPRIMLPPGGTP